MTYIEVAQQAAKSVNVTLSDADADYVLWEQTGFPDFFQPSPGQGHVDEIQRQVRRWCVASFNSKGMPV